MKLLLLLDGGVFQPSVGPPRGLQRAIRVGLVDRLTVLDRDRRGAVERGALPALDAVQAVGESTHVVGERQVFTDEPSGGPKIIRRVLIVGVQSVQRGHAPRLRQRRLHDAPRLDEERRGEHRGFVETGERIYSRRIRQQLFDERILLRFGQL